MAAAIALYFPPCQPPLLSLLFGLKEVSGDVARLGDVGVLVEGVGRGLCRDRSGLSRARDGEGFLGTIKAFNGLMSSPSTAYPIKPCPEMAAPIPVEDVGRTCENPHRGRVCASERSEVDVGESRSMPLKALASWTSSFFVEIKSGSMTVAFRAVLGCSNLSMQ